MEMQEFVSIKSAQIDINCTKPSFKESQHDLVPCQTPGSEYFGGEFTNSSKDTFDTLVQKYKASCIRSDNNYTMLGIRGASVQNSVNILVNKCTEKKDKRSNVRVPQKLGTS